jgi:hypothetical protein
MIYRDCSKVSFCKIVIDNQTDMPYIVALLFFRQRSAQPICYVRPCWCGPSYRSANEKSGDFSPRGQTLLSPHGASPPYPHEVAVNPKIGLSRIFGITVAAFACSNGCGRWPPQGRDAAVSATQIRPRKR